VRRAHAPLCPAGGEAARHWRRVGNRLRADADGPSLPSRLQALEDVLSYLVTEIGSAQESAAAARARAEEVARVQVAVNKGLELSRGHAVPRPPAAGAKRDRHGLRGIPGGLAALAPAHAHCGLMLALARGHPLPAAGTLLAAAAVMAWRRRGGRRARRRC
jgi:hypothetical protein